MKKQCPICGEYIEQEITICPYCNEQITEDDKPEETVIPEDEDKPIKTETKKINLNTNIIIVILSLIFILRKSSPEMRGYMFYLLFF